MSAPEIIPRERVREMMASDYYYGGMYVRSGGNLHPARYYKGLLEAAHGQGVVLCGNVEAERIEKTNTAKTGSGWRVLTAKGPIACKEVVIATNGYTGDLTPKLKMRVVPVASHIIATEELPMPATDLIPLQRSIGDTKRVLTYYRPSPDGRHMIFGGRARFTAAPPEVSAPILYQYSESTASRSSRVHPHSRMCGRGQCRLRAQFDVAHGPGRRHALSAGLQRQRRRDDDLSGHPDGQEDRRRLQRAGSMPSTGREFPEHPLYNGDPSLYLPLIGALYRTRDLA